MEYGGTFIIGRERIIEFTNVLYHEEFVFMK